MSLRIEDVRAYLDPDEPSYAEAAALGAEAIPALQELVNSSDHMLAAKATYLAGMIPVPESAEILAQAAQNTDPVVRVAAAAALGDRSDVAAADEILLPLLADSDGGVRKAAINSVRPDAGEEVVAKVEAIAHADGDVAMRDIARAALHRHEPEARGSEMTAEEGVGEGGGDVGGDRAGDGAGGGVGEGGGDVGGDRAG